MGAATERPATASAIAGPGDKPGGTGGQTQPPPGPRDARPGSGAGGPPPGGTSSPSGGTGGTRGGGGTKGGFASGLIGGAISGIAASLLVMFGLQPDTSTDRAMVQTAVSGVDAQATQIAALTERLQALEHGSAPDDGLTERLAALEAQLAEQQTARQAAGAAPGELDAVLGQLGGRLDELEQAIAQVPADQTSPAADELRDRLAAVESALTALPETAVQGEEPGDRTAVAALESRLALLEAQLPEPAMAEQTATELAALEQRLTTAEQAGGRVGELVGTVDEVRTAVQTSQERLLGVGDQVTALRDRVDGVAGTVQALEQRVTTIQDRLDSAEDRRERAAALALLTTQLDAALAESRPYDRLLATLTELAKDDPTVEDAVAKLEPAAATGIPDLMTLRERFSATANEIVHQARAPEGDGLIDRATDNLMRLVTIRPVGADAQGDSPEARVARAEAKLAQGDLAGAVAELEQLEGAPAAAAAEWLELARMRLAAREAVTSLQAHTTALLTEAR